MDSSHSLSLSADSVDDGFVPPRGLATLTAVAASCLGMYTLRRSFVMKRREREGLRGDRAGLLRGFRAGLWSRIDSDHPKLRTALQAGVVVNPRPRQSQDWRLYPRSPIAEGSLPSTSSSTRSAYTTVSSLRELDRPIRTWRDRKPHDTPANQRNRHGRGSGHHRRSINGVHSGAIGLQQSQQGP